MNPKFIQSFLLLASEFKVPVFFPRLSREEIVAIGHGEYADAYLEILSQLEGSGFPLLDQIIIDTGGEHSNKINYYCKRISEIKPGLSHLLFHPAKLSSELKAITPDSVIWRDQDYRAFTNLKIKECIEKHNIKLIGYREIRDYFQREFQ